MTGMVETADIRVEEERKSSLRLGWILAIGWTVVVTLYFLWEADGYRGLFGALSEWQYAKLDQALPLFTFAALTFLFALPAWLILGALIVRRRRGESPPVSPEGIWLVSARRFQQGSMILAGLLGAIALAVLLWAIFLPNKEATVRLIAPDGSPAAVAGSNPETGIVVGTPDMRLASTMAQDLLFTRRNVQFAPILETNRSKTIRYFVELGNDDARDTAMAVLAPDRTTNMVVSRMPGAIVTLYRNIGYQVTEPNYLISPSTPTLRWPYLVAAGQVALVALIALLLGLVQMRRIRRIERSAQIPSVE